ncbi:MAG: molybdopterin-dependent oxidoreductase [Actinomycetota bacterium]|nr:molybdopterin-dependent oxidoreductase [Actinomycetota bacterium]
MSVDMPESPSVPPARRQLFLGGALTGLAGVATSQAATALLRQETSPVVAVAEVIRDRTPGAIAVPLIHLVQHLDKPLLVAGTTLGLVLLAGFAGVQTARRPWLSYAVLMVMGLLALLAVMTRPNAGPAAFIPLAVGFGTWIAMLSWLTAPRVNPGERRAFLLRAGLAAAGTIAVVGFAQWVGRARTRVEDARKLLRLSATPGTVPVGADLGVSKFQPWRTSNDHFYQIHTAISLPAITPDQWQLRIHGMVDKTLTVTYADLVNRQLTEKWVTLCCVSNFVGGSLVGNAFWSGVPIRELLAQAGVKPGADAVKQTSQDGWTCGTPLSALTDPHRDAMLAIAMNGKPLPVEHGFPVRMVVPGLYGYVSATKWLVDIEVTQFSRFTAYWTDRGWSEQGPVKTESRIDVPLDGQQMRPGTQRFGGSAWAQHTGISKVEFQLDGGHWQQAELGRVADDDSWVQWAGTAVLAKGNHVLMVKATDKSGYTQTSVKHGTVPNGATGWHTVAFTAGLD